MDANYDAIIVGSGVGGLTCGNLLAKHGMKVLIVEEHFLPGGYCTSYRRDNCHFDVPVVISSMRKGGHVEELLSYIGVAQNIEFLEIDKLAKIVGPDIELSWYSDIYKLEHEFINKFRHEKENIRKYFKTIREIWYEMQEVHYKPSLLQMLSYPLRFPNLFKYKSDTFQQFVDRFFEDKKLKELLGKEAVTLALGEERVSALYYIGMIMSYAEGGIWYPKGGFQQISDSFCDCFKQYGGTLRLKTKCKKVIVQNGRAIGVELVNGEKIYGTYVVSNADTKKTFLELVDAKYLKRSFLNKIKNLEQSYSGIVVKLAVKIDLAKFKKHAWLFSFPEYGSTNKMTELASKDELDLDSCSFSIDTSSLLDDNRQPAGVSVISLVVLPLSYNWNNKWLYSDKVKYKKLKEEIADKLVLKAERFIPNLSKSIITKDISTPLTYERYTNATSGGWYDIAAISEQIITNRCGPDTPIKGLFLAGAKSVMGGGLNSAISSGLYTADMILEGKLTSGKGYLKSELLKE